MIVGHNQLSSSLTIRVLNLGGLQVLGGVLDRILLLSLLVLGRNIDIGTSILLGNLLGSLLTTAFGWRRSWNFIGLLLETLDLGLGFCDVL